MNGSRLVLAAALLAVPTTAARADLVLSDLILDLGSGGPVRRDIEVWNDSDERSFVSVEPREILQAGLPQQSDRRDPDPEKLGLLVAPARMVLEPHQRKLVRIANLGADQARERVYRVTVSPVAGAIKGEADGLKVMVGYDVLVLVRPQTVSAKVAATRGAKVLTFTNEGNVSVELIEGRQCRAARTDCRDLPGKRLYPGATWTLALPFDGPADLVVKSPGKSDRRTY